MSKDNNPVRVVNTNSTIGLLHSILLMKTFMYYGPQVLKDPLEFWLTAIRNYTSHQKKKENNLILHTYLFIFYFCASKLKKHHNIIYENLFGLTTFLYPYKNQLFYKSGFLCLQQQQIYIYISPEQSHLEVLYDGSLF